MAGCRYPFAARDKRIVRGIRWLFALPLVFVLCAAPAAARTEPGGDDETRIPLVLDTDFGMDDARALALILEWRPLKLLGVSTVFGSCSAEAAARNCIGLLGSLRRRPIPVAIGAEKPLEGRFEPPPWRARCEAQGLRLQGAEGHDPRYEPGHELLARLVKGAGGEARLVCLGPLTNLARALEQDPELAGSIHTLLLPCVGSGRSDEFNIAADPLAAKRVFEAGIKTVVLLPCPETGQGLDFARVLEGLSGELISTPASLTLRTIYEESGNRELLEQGHFTLADEYAALHLIRPNLFSGEGPYRASVETGPDGRVEIRLDGESSASGVLLARPAVSEGLILRTTLDIMGGILTEASAAQHPEHPGQDSGGPPGVMLRGFPPEHGGAYRDDVSPVAEAVAARHGPEEWRWAVLASELHNHLGIYTLIGVKMGLRAREILAAPRAVMEITPHCGSEPPISCLIDGVLVATGSTPGRGLLLESTAAVMMPDFAELEAADSLDFSNSPACDFYFEDRLITLRLKPAVEQSIDRSLEALLERHGGQTPAYFAALRAEALRLLLELDRNEIFEVVE